MDPYGLMMIDAIASSVRCDFLTGWCDDLIEVTLIHWLKSATVVIERSPILLYTNQ